MKTLIILLTFFSLTVATAAPKPKPIDLLEERVAELEAKPPQVQVLANGEIIGFFLDRMSLGYAVISQTNYVFGVPVSPETNPVFVEPVTVLFYSEPTCTTPPLAMSENGQLTHWTSTFLAQQGVVFNAISSPGSASEYWYVPRGAQPVTWPALHVLESGGECRIFGGPFSTFEIFPNDPAITGVPNEPFTPPITLGQ